MATVTAAQKADLALKGVFDGNCNVESCQRSIAGENFYNTSTSAYYCRQCAREINRWSRRDEGKTICVPVTDPNDKPPFPIEPNFPARID